MKKFKLNEIAGITELANNELIVINGGDEASYDFGWYIGWIGGVIVDAFNSISDLPPSTLYD